ncbi:hypothetical protein A7982_13589 [Minicystis rosea]|nr:hypothetical protein A7982_13589 [Minicystis rosea]
MSAAGVRLVALQHEFDTIFAKPLPSAPDRMEELLAIRLDGAPFALRIRELAAIRAYRAPTPLPGGPPGLLGVGGDDGRLLAVYDLARVLGRNRGDAALRWLVIPRADAQLGLAFCELDGCLRIPASALLAQEGEVAGSIEAMLAPSDEGAGRPLLDLASIVSTVHRNAE